MYCNCSRGCICWELVGLLILIIIIIIISFTIKEMTIIYINLDDTKLQIARNFHFVINFELLGICVVVWSAPKQS